MTHPTIYIGSAAIAGGALVLEAMKQASAPDTMVAQITAYGVIVLGVMAAIPIIIAAYGAVLAARAAALAKTQLATTEDVAVKINGHWTDIEKRLNEADDRNLKLIEAVAILTARVAVADQAAAVALTEKAATLEATRVKELADAKAAPAEPRP